MDALIESIRKKTYEELNAYSCDSCGNAPKIEDVGFCDAEFYGTIEHGRGCYVDSADGGGSTSVELPGDLGAKCVLLEEIERLSFRLSSLDK